MQSAGSYGSKVTLCGSPIYMGYIDKDWNSFVCVHALPEEVEDSDKNER